MKEGQGKGKGRRRGPTSKAMGKGRGGEESGGVDEREGLAPRRKKQRSRMHAWK